MEVSQKNNCLTRGIYFGVLCHPQSVFNVNLEDGIRRRNIYLELVNCFFVFFILGLVNSYHNLSSRN